MKPQWKRLSAATLAVLLAAYAVDAIGDDKWEECFADAVVKWVGEYTKEHPGDSRGLVESGAGYDEAINACGYAEPPKEIPPDVLKQLQEHCKDNPTAWEANFIRWGVQHKYGEKYAEEVIAKECQRIARERTAKNGEPSARTGFRIARVYNPAPGYTNAIIETDRERIIKCAAKLQDEFQAVEETTITPPVDEIIFSVEADSVICWPQ